MCGTKTITGEHDFMDSPKPRGKRKTQDPCLGCGLHKNLCLCGLIPELRLGLDLKTRISLVIHHRELKRTTNSGTLALKVLGNSLLRVRGQQDQGTLDLSDLLTSEYRTFLFFPCDGAIELSPELIAQSRLPIQLIVPDGNWRQASKVHYRHSELKDIPRVMISAPNTAAFHLRRESSEIGMSTLEAIAQALGVIEGINVKEALMKLYNLKLERTLMGRGNFSSKK